MRGKRRWFASVAVCSAVAILANERAWATNSVAVESKIVVAGSTGVQVGVSVRNDVPIIAMVLPLEFRSVTAGSFIKTSLSVAAPAGNRVGQSPLGAAGPNWPAASITNKKYAATATPECTTTPGRTYSLSVPQVDFVSPDAILYSSVSTGDTLSGEKIMLDPGADPPGTANASVLLAFDVTNVPGSFEIDTCCVSPANHLVYIDVPQTYVRPAFTKGVITIVASSSSVTVESKTVPTGATGVQVGVSVKNDIPIIAAVLPLELRSVTPGSFITMSLSVTTPGNNRVGQSPLGAAGQNWPAASVTSNKYAVPSTPECSTTPGRSYGVSAPQVDFVSPDAVLYATVSTGDALSGERIALDPGSDPPGTANASFLLTFDVTNVLGSFEIDTCCVGPANHLTFVDVPQTYVVPAFTKGVITIAEVGFSATPLTGDAPLTVFFTGDNLSGIPIDSWSWDFGDGGSATVQNPIHVYNVSGIYTVTLTAMQGASAFVAQQTNYISINSIHADFSASPRGGAAPLAVAFTDLSSGGATAWTWNFGDGSVSAQQSPVHIYMNPDLYDVTLTVANSGNSDVKHKLAYVRVDVAPVPDQVVTLYGSLEPRPGFDLTYSLFLRNDGTAPASGQTLQFVMPSQTTYVSSNPPGSVSLGTVNWITGTLNPGDPAAAYQITVNIPVAVTAGTVLSATANVSTAAGETVLSNNSDADNAIVVSSIDPNDLLVKPDGCGPGKDWIQGTPPLTYTALFENKPEATASAIYVLVVDTLDPRLDWASLEVGPTSKDNVLSFNFDPESGELLWFFNGINLPPNVNPPEGEGFVAYTVRPKPGLADGTLISSRAHIRFDFNPWLAAPDAGPLNVLIQPCCTCPCHGDPKCDAVTNILDVVGVINVAFRALPEQDDADCPKAREDVDCSGTVDVLDVVHLVNVAFRGQDPATQFCNACQ